VIAELGMLSRWPERVQGALGTIWSTAPGFLRLLVHSALIPIITFFLLKDAPLLKRQCLYLVPRDLEAPLLQILQKISLTLNQVIKGQLIVSMILAILYSVGLSIVGLKAGIVIGITAGICRFIPYLDVLVGGTLSLLVIIADYHDFQEIIKVAVVFVLVQAMDGAFITPRVIGERVGLHPMLVIVSVIAFSEIYGLWGAVLAIPLLAVAKVLWSVFREVYLSSSLYYMPSEEGR
jgi:predicted PurR-regulated permease PerM